MRRARLVIVLWAGCLLAAWPGGAGADPVDDYVLQQLAARHAPGVSVAVVRNGEVALAKGYGEANVELDAPATAETVYQLASVTKQFTATAVMLLVEAGKLALDDPVGKHLPDLPAAWRPVTVRQLLNHTSGIKSYTSLPGWEAKARQEIAREELIKLVADAPPDFKPGEKWAYNNTGYFLLGMLIEKASGQEYGAFLQERIFQPLGMTRTRLNDLRAIIPGRAQGYSWGRGGLRNGEYVSPSQPYAAGALVSTVRDMAKWDAALYSERVLKRASLEQMWTPTPLPDGKSQDYGFGWAVDTYRDHKRISHGGGIPGFSTNICRFVDDRLTVIVLANSDSAAADSLATGIAAFYLPDLAAKAPRPIADDDPKLTAQLKEVAVGLAAGKIDAGRLTDQFARFLTPERLQQGKELLGGAGELKAFELVETRQEEGRRVRGYRARFGPLAIRITFILADDGKIAGVGLRPE